jgi:trimeric autotransporter adhesin
MKTIIPSVLITFAIVSFALVPNTQAVNPPPDGGYPGGNTAEGDNTLFSLTTGTYNTAVGVFSLQSNTSGDFNTAIGAGTLLANTAGQNTATGAGALLSNTTGDSNTANGAFALFDNTTGGVNTAIGFATLGNNTTGSFNTAIGVNALLNNTGGGSNTATGYQALLNTTGNHNTGTGWQALFSNTTGAENTAMGYFALNANTTGSNNIALGSSAGINVTTAHNVICVGADGMNVNNSCFIGNIFNATSSGGTAVLINTDGRLGTVTSSQRFKEHIKPMEQASEALYALKPVTFRYHKGIDPQGTPQFRLVAEDVEKVNPDLVVRDKEGKPYTVRYDQVNAMLLNEFLKAHQKMEEQGATIAKQQKQIEALTAGLQKMSAQFQLSKSSEQTVNNNQ